MVSIIIPVYNKELFIRESVDSVLNQTYSDIEIVVINDGSTDGSLAILEEFADRFPEIVRLINSQNRGVSGATNLGIQAARGEYIQFLDADDFISVDKIEKQMRLLTGKGLNAIAICEWVNFKDNRSQCSRLSYDVFRDFRTGLKLLLRFWNYQEMMAISSYLIRRELIENAGPWNESLTINQDGEFFTRVLLQTDQVLFEPKGKVYYRTPGLDNVSQQKGFGAMASLLDSYKAYERAILPVEDSPRVRLALKKVYQKFIYDVFPLHPDLIEKAECLILNLGVEEPTYIGGPKFQQLSKLFGFKNALRLKRFLH